MDRTEDLQDQRLQARREAMLDAAEYLFGEQGFDDTTLNAIVARSGGSLATLYKLFETKEGLLAQVLHRRPDQARADIAEVRALGLPPAQMLREMLMRLRAKALSNENIRLVRAMVAQSIRDETFSQQFRGEHLERAIAEMSEIFADLQAKGQIAPDDPEVLARMFFSMISFDIYTAVARFEMFHKRTREQVEAEFSLFLRTIGLEVPA
ncbi:TetR/AcrR family transcriptional regulator [Aurantiacibacter flavus]|uniref:TetR/AcrR family transcriptional regulator n=1 Tax=Aurantiacibacter flavus TaxID=3145232 RepID=A0ABV0CVJ2_9SPHN